VTEFNAHPHVSSGDIAVVHNGIIENHEEQRDRLKRMGYVFESQTDTEVIAHLIHHYFQKGKDLFAATRSAVAELVGAYAIAVICKHAPDQMVCARMGCPLLIGLGEGENYIASDVSALLSATRRVIYLEDGDSARLTRDGITLLDLDGNRIEREVHVSDVSLASLELGPYSHFMQKEIYEQPRALTDSIEAVIDSNSFDVELFGAQAAETFRNIDAILILAAGTSYYAGLTAKYWLESIARLPTSVEIASEYRYRSSVPNPRQLIITISQSGETLDTMEALKHANRWGRHRRYPSATCRKAPFRAPRSWCSTPAPEPRSASLPPRRSPRNWLRCSSSRPRWPSSAACWNHSRNMRCWKRCARSPAACNMRSTSNRRYANGQNPSPPSSTPCSSARHPLPDRAGRRAEAQGDLLHPRRGLSGGRTQARPAGTGG